MTLQATVSIGWVNTVLAAAEQQDVARETALAAAGIASFQWTQAAAMRPVAADEVGNGFL